MHTFREFVDLAEIQRFSQSDFRGGKQELDHPETMPRVSEIRPLPSHAGYGYTITPLRQGTAYVVHLFDLQPQQHGYQDTTRRYTKAQRTQKDFTPLIGQLSASKASTLRVNRTPLTLYQIENVTLDEQSVYRNKGLGLAMYVLLLHLPRVAVIAGESQTPAGRAMWVKLAAHPQVQVEGLMSFPDDLFWFHDEPESRRVVDTLFGTLGVDYLGDGNTLGVSQYPEKARFFTFPVMSSEFDNPTRKIKELMAVQKHAWTTLYGSAFRMDHNSATLIARAVR